MTSLFVVPFPSYPRMKGRASALHRLDPHPCLMSYRLGCNYETRSLVGNGRMPCTVPQHPILRLPPVVVGQLSGSSPLDDNQPHSPPPPLICGPFVVEEGENRDCDCPCQDQSQNTPTFTLPSPCHSPELPQQAVVLHPLITTKVGARLSLFCDTWRQKGCNAWVCNVLEFGFRLCFREKPPMTRGPVTLCGQGSHCEETSSPDISSDNADKQGNRTGTRHLSSGVLQSSVPCPPKVRRMETGDRPLVTQYLLGASTLHDEDNREYPAVAPSGRLGHINRSGRCILPHPNPPRLQKVSSLSDSRCHLPVQGTTIWPLPSTMGFHQSYVGS